MLIFAALICLLPALLPDNGLVQVAAQISPLSPLQTGSSGGPSISMGGATLINVMASGQAGLMSLALLLVAIIIAEFAVVSKREQQAHL